MTSAHCCGADKIFDLKNAQRELKKYRKKGPGKSTRKLIQSISKYKKADKTLLDIGGGIGAIIWDFLRQGGNHATDVDASSAYLDTARNYAIEQNLESRVSFMQGDITEVLKDDSIYDYVTMDKVICCYPDYQLLLNHALAKCGQVLAVSFPIGGSIAHFFNFFTLLYLKIKKNPFRTFIHPSPKIKKFIEEKGFVPKYQGISFPWRIWVFEKKKL